MKDYKMQRKMFNVYAGIDLVKYLRYSYGTKEYQEKIRTQKISALARNAYAIPFYKKRFDEAGVDPATIKKKEDFAKLPLLTKDEFRIWMEEEAEKPENKYCMTIRTSGSSGMPLPVMLTPKEYASDIANVLRAMIVGGYNPIFGKTLTEVDDSSEDVGYKSFIQRLGILRREIFDEDMEADKIINLVNSYKPDIIRMYKSEMLRVAIYAEKNGIKFHDTKFQLAIGENIDEVSANIINRNWGGKLINLYGCVENGAIAVKKPGDSKYLIFDDACAVNIYNSENKLSDEGRVILTPLYKYRFPLINYDLKDIVSVNKEDKRYFDVIKGRANDVIKYSDGSKSDWIQIWHIFALQKDIFQVRLIQNSYEELICEMVMRDGCNKEMVKSAINKELSDKIIKGRIHLTINEVESIPAEASGKVRMVISNVE